MKQKFAQMSDEVKNTILVSASVLIIISIFFVLTLIRVNQPTKIIVPPFFSDNSIQYNEIMIGSMLSMPEKEYYVLVYIDSYLKDYYESLLATNEQEYRYYKADLNSFFNHHFYAEETVINKNNLKFSEDAIVIIKDGEIKEVLVDIKEIAEYFN